jgi:glycosyltransferase involved in cell wall biosynthesis
MLLVLPSGKPRDERERIVRIALLGTRGIPASYSGFETCAEQLGKRLVSRGHSVTVYCRSHHITYDGPFYEGIRLVKLPSIRNKHLDTIVHAFLSSIHALGQRYDIALYFIVGNSPVTWIPRVVGQKTILNVDGLDWKREKWSKPAKMYLQAAERWATWMPNTYITDSRTIQAYYEERFGAAPPFIPYGSDVEPMPPGEFLRRYELQPRRYVLFVGRLVPENCAHHLVQAFSGLETDMRCVIVGDAPYAEGYIAELKRGAGEGVVFTGYLFGDGYRELSSHAYLFVEPSGVGGTHPALVESMAFGNCVVVQDTPENLETVGDAGFAYDGSRGAAALRPVLELLLSSPDVVQEYRHRARQRAAAEFSWDRVTDDYERMFYQLLGRPLPERLRRP